MDAATRQIVEAIHQAPYRCALAVAGGGTDAVALLLGVPGASRTVLEAVVPYHDQALAEYLGFRPETFCSAVTGGDMAARAHERAGWLAPAADVVGVGCTATLATDRIKRGDHRFHVAVRTRDQLTNYSLTLSKGARDREGEEQLLSQVLLNALAAAFQVRERLEPALLPGEVLHRESVPVGSLLESFLDGRLPAVCVEADGRVRSPAAPPSVLLPGAFNPVHAGHRGMAAAAGRLTGLPVAAELSVTNVDKPPLGPEEVRRRLGQFTWHLPVWLTRAPTFVQKAMLFPGTVFVVGADTAARIVAPRYYQDTDERLAEALARIRAEGCRFLVACRADPSGRVMTLSELRIPEAFRDLFRELPEAEFRLPISSTQLRERGEREAPGM